MLESKVLIIGHLRPLSGHVIETIHRVNIDDSTIHGVYAQVNTISRILLYTSKKVSLYDLGNFGC